MVEVAKVIVGVILAHGIMRYIKAQHKETYDKWFS